MNHVEYLSSWSCGNQIVQAADSACCIKIMIGGMRIKIKMTTIEGRCNNVGCLFILYGKEEDVCR